MININKIIGECFYTSKEIADLTKSPLDLIDHMLESKLISLNGDKILGS